MQLLAFVENVKSKYIDNIHFILTNFMECFKRTSEEIFENKQQRNIDKI